MRITKKTIGLLTLPVVYLISTYVLINYIPQFSKPWPTIMQYVSYVLFLFGILLGSRFNKSRVVFLCLILGISQTVLSNDLFFKRDLIIKHPEIFDIIYLLIPINVFLFSIFKERGILTFWGKMRFGLIIAQLMIIWWVLQPENSQIRSLIYHNILGQELTYIIPVPHITVLLFSLASIFLIIRMLVKPTLMDSSLIGVLLTVFYGLCVQYKLMALQISFAMSGLILIIGIIETSYSMAYLDELTRIPARRALKESMLKLGGQYTIAMIDIDFFKKFNDRYGHDAGDEVLKMVASNLQRVTGGGKAFRYGGEEFTILFPNRTSKQAISHLEELRQRVAKQRYSYKKKGRGKKKTVTQNLSVTVSIGVAEKSDKYKSPEEVLKAADKALYRAKNKGRNCVSK